MPNILRHQNGETIAAIRLELEALGYAVDVHEYSPHESGVPQIGERAYFVRSLDEIV